MSAVLQPQYADEDEPLFPDAAAALKFLTRVQYENFERSVLADLASGPRPFGRGLGGLEGAGTAGLIGAQLATLPQLHRRILLAKYAPRASECECGRACCQGWKANAHWLIEVAWVSATVWLELQMPLLKDKQKIKDAMVVRYFGNRDKKNMEELAKAAGVHRNTLSEYNNQLVTLLKKEEKAAYGAIEERLISAGLVG